MKNKAIFLDRDGTLNYENRNKLNPKGFMLDIKKLQLIIGSINAIRLLNEMNYKVIVITNQSGVGRGLFTEDFVNRVHEKIDKMLANGGVSIDGYYYCPHHPTEAKGKYKKICSCRKPAPGMIFTAAEEHNVDLSQSYFIGDGLRDMKCAWMVKVKPILVLTGNGEITFDTFSEKEKNKLEYVAQDLLDAAQYLYNK